MEAFDAQAVAYLMKPIRKERLARALRHAARPTRPQLTALTEANELPSQRRHISARIADRLRLIPVANVLYFKADQKYVCVRHSDGEVLIDEALKALEEEFAPEFLRIHRNALVSLKYLLAVEREADGHYVARLRDCDELLSVSRRHAAGLRRRIRAGS